MNAAPQRDESVRRCVACRTVKQRTQLIRLTYSAKENRFSLNNEVPLNGRSAYLCPHPDCYRLAMKGKKLQKALKRGIPSDILESLGQVFKGRENQ